MPPIPKSLGERSLDENFMRRAMRGHCVFALEVLFQVRVLLPLYRRNERKSRLWTYRTLTPSRSPLQAEPPS